jgi:hypothetical protein
LPAILRPPIPGLLRLRLAGERHSFRCPQLSLTPHPRHLAAGWRTRMISARSRRAARTNKGDIIHLAPRSMSPVHSPRIGRACMQYRLVTRKLARKLVSRKLVSVHHFPHGNWAGSRWGLPPSAPTDPDVRVEGASGSSRCGFAVPHTTRRPRGDTRGGSMPSAWFRPPVPQRGAPFAPPGPGGPVPPLPHYYGALRLPDVRLAALRSLRLAIPSWCPSFVPISPGHGCGSTWSW